MPQRGRGVGEGQGRRRTSFSQLCLFLPKHLSVIRGGPGQEVAEGASEYQTNEISLFIQPPHTSPTPSSPPPPAAPLLSAGRYRVGAVSPQTKVSEPISLGAAHSEDVRKRRRRTRHLTDRS